MTNFRVRLPLPKLRLVACALLLAFAPMSGSRPATAGPGTAEPAADASGDFVVSHDLRGLAGLASARDPHRAQVLAQNARLGVVLKY
jgi:hypothetical protein